MKCAPRKSQTAGSVGSKSIAVPKHLRNKDKSNSQINRASDSSRNSVFPVAKLQTSVSVVAKLTTVKKKAQLNCKPLNVPSDG